jgi:hypothetical protein
MKNKKKTKKVEKVSTTKASIVWIIAHFAGFIIGYLIMKNLVLYLLG